jgi:hypothetical protein
MKIMVKLEILMAILLLLTPVAFADGPCYCYKIDFTELDEPANDTSFVKICFDHGDSIGEIYGICSRLCAPPELLYMFFDSMNEQALTSYAVDSVTMCMAHLKFHGDNQYVATGIHYNGFNFGSRWSFRGHQTEMYHCNCNP